MMIVHATEVKAVAATKSLWAAEETTETATAIKTESDHTMVVGMRTADNAADTEEETRTVCHMVVYPFFFASTYVSSPFVTKGSLEDPRMQHHTNERIDMVRCYRSTTFDMKHNLRIVGTLW